MRVHGLVWMEFSSQPDLVKLKNSQSNKPVTCTETNPTQPTWVQLGWLGSLVCTFMFYAL